MIGCIIDILKLDNNKIKNEKNGYYQQSTEIVPQIKSLTLGHTLHSLDKDQIKIKTKARWIYQNGKNNLH